MIRYDCKNCKRDVHCCIFKNPSQFAFVGLKHAKLIKQRIHKDYDQFLDYSPLPKNVVKALRNCDPCLEGALRYSQLDRKKRLIRLKAKKDRRCIFLDDSSRCEIYDIRPNICRIFPFWAIRLNNGKLKIITHDLDPSCSAVRSLNISRISPKDASNIRKVMKDIEKEDAYYKKNIAKFWKNVQQPRT
ncbi:MAG: YkgJ family cysteine cluster protein [Candidatus Woesearchaeota archaeon]|nr:YkgJ family cysteine cluster protein [Candidatus Woesearchaeota archaeon]